MRSRILFALALATTSGCYFTERSNPYDPDGTVNPTVVVMQPYSVSCRQWDENGAAPFLFPPGFTKNLLSVEEQAEISNRCDLVCAASDCQQYVFLTSAVRDPVERCTEAVGALELRYREILYVSDAERTVDILLPAAADLRVEGAADGGLFTITTDTSNETDDDQYFDYVVAYQAIYVGHVTRAAWERFRDRVLLTRSLASVDRNSIVVTLSDGFGANQTACRIDVRFDQATEIVAHPLAFGGGYGRHVAIADLPLDDAAFAPEVSRLEFATTYATGDGVCWVDVIYRDASSGALAHAPPDGTFYGLGAMCDADGGPPPVASGRFLPADGEAFAVPYVDFIGQWINFIGPDEIGSFEIDVPEYFLFEAFTGVPLLMEGVGPFLGGLRDTLALVPPAGNPLVLCSTSGSCTSFDAPACAGGTATFVDIAPKPPEVETTQLLVATQSTNGTCVVWLDAAPSVTVARQEEFAAVEPVAVHWTTNGGLPSAVAVGYLDPSDPETMVFEMPAVPAAETRFSLVYDNDTCERVLTAASDGLTTAAFSEPLLECPMDGSGCSLYAYRGVGLPGIDIFHSDGIDGGFVVPDEGGIAYYGVGCADPADVYYAIGLPFLGEIVPTTIATSVAARLDPPRARVVEESPTLCQVPSTVLLGAPADGPLGGTGRVVVTYTSGDQFRTQPYCVPAGLP